MRPSIELIRATVAAEFKVSVADLVGPSRLSKFVEPRDVAVYLTRELTPHSNGVIGRFFGGRDSSTILVAHRRMAELRKRDLAIAIRVARIRAQLVAETHARKLAA